MSATEAQAGGGGVTSGELRLKGLKLPPPAPPRFSLELKIFAAAALLIFIAVGGAVAVSAIRARSVADAKIAEDLKKAGPGWESFQQNRYDELHRSLAVVVNNAGTISMMSTLVPETGRPDPATVFDTLKREQASSARADFLIATTPQGIGLARTDRPLPYSADLSGVPTISGAMQGAQTEAIWLSGGKLYHVVAAPVLEGGSRRRGDRRGLPGQRRGAEPNSLINARSCSSRTRRPVGEPRPVVAARRCGTSRLAESAGAAGSSSRPFRQGKTIGPLPLELGRHLPRLLPPIRLDQPARRLGRPLRAARRSWRPSGDPEHAGPRRDRRPVCSPLFFLAGASRS
jgi:hypothetical protein